MRSMDYGARRIAAFTWLGWLLMSLAAGCAPRNDHIEIKWTVLNNDSPPGPTLRMNIPRAYIVNVVGDSSGEDERIHRVKNGGIGALDLEFIYPDLSPGKATDDANPSSAKKRIYVQFNSVYRHRGGLGIRDQFIYEAKKGMVYRLPEQHGLERFRRMGCTPNSFDPTRYDEALNEPPNGCWELGEESLIGRDGDVAVWITCGRGEGRCAMHTHFQQRWQLTLAFPRSLVAEWRKVKDASEELLSGFVGTTSQESS